jgi:NAD+ synthase (glutamine-hydrolysing)
LKVALAQINSFLGNFEENKEKILEYAELAAVSKADIVLYPELALFGYPPGDLLERTSIVKNQLACLVEIQKQLPDGPALLFGVVSECPKKQGKPFYNSAVFLQKNKKPKFFHKELLPSYDVFDETRHIEPGRLEKNILRFKGKNILVAICEDGWSWPLKNFKPKHLKNPMKDLKKSDVDLIFSLNSSPYSLGKTKLRKKMMAQSSNYFNCPLVYVNQVGGQDELIFDGDSFVLNKDKLVLEAKRFEEDFQIVDIGNLPNRKTGPKKLSENQELRKSLVLGISDFSKKTGLSKVHLGASGGIDSALVAALAAEALGPENVTLIAMPSKFNADESLVLAEKLAKNLGARFHTIEIQTIYETVLNAFQKAIGSFDFHVTNENMQSRIRGLLLMAYSNKEGSLLLTTGNKPEYATGYATLYGDMCGGLAPIADLLKNQVYSLSRHYNEQDEIIPQRIIDRPPSAELAPDQQDQDSLPPYDELDQSVKNLVEKTKSPSNEIDKWLLGALMKTEFKRWQAAPILRVSDHAFGRGRRLPIAHKAWA